MKTILGVNYFFGEGEKNDGFVKADKPGPARFAHRFKEWMESRYDVEVHSWDCIDWNSDSVKWVVYLDASWRSLMRDPYLNRIPRSKRALVMIEPANVNPALYYLSYFRGKFARVFAYDERLLKTHPDYRPVNVLPWAEPVKYRVSPYPTVPFAEKKLLFAASRNRWHYMPQSTYNLRRRAYAWFERHQPDQFDLYGQYWNAPVVCFERWFGYPHYENYRGELPNGGAGKVEKMAQYKFALCFENNASQPGYISEKITDCLCARCVPIYYGSRGVEKRIPRECFIDYRDFRSLAELEQFLVRMDERTYNRYLDAIERFLNSESAEYFTSDNFFRLIANGLGLSARVGSSN